MNPLFPPIPKLSTARIAALTLATALQAGFSDKAAAAIAPRNPATAATIPSRDVLKPYFGENSTYLDLQEAEKENRLVKGDQLRVRKIEFLPTRDPSTLPQNGLSLFYNDA